MLIERKRTESEKASKNTSVTISVTITTEQVGAFSVKQHLSFPKQIWSTPSSVLCKIKALHSNGKGLHWQHRHGRFLQQKICHSKLFSFTCLYFDGTSFCLFNRNDQCWLKSNEIYTSSSGSLISQNYIQHCPATGRSCIWTMHGWAMPWDCYLW